MMAKILWIEGRRADSPSFVPSLRKKEYQVETVSTGSAAMEKVLEFVPDVVVVNAASMRSSGKRICTSMRQQVNGLPIIVITNNKDKGIYPANCATVVLPLPFTLRKLVNRINSFVPADENRLIRKGPIRLDLERKRVYCQGREGKLTPRLAQLLHILMERAGEVVERENLFREVWKTEYTGDTRTLDVHISWLRQAFEDDPKNPHFLKTIRKVGYRLDV
jgi:DNA-binding response OmpR family regulator